MCYPLPCVEQNACPYCSVSVRVLETKGAEEEVASPGDIESSTTSHTSGLDILSLDAKMQEIEDSLQEMDIPPEAMTPTPAAARPHEEEEEEDSDSDDEDEGGEAGLCCVCVCHYQVH